MLQNPQMTAFIRNNLLLLLSKENKLDELKHKKFEYFKIQLKGKFGIPKNTELARCVLVYCISHNIIHTIEELESFVSKTWFLRKNIFHK